MPLILERSPNFSLFPLAPPNPFILSHSFLPSTKGYIYIRSLVKALVVIHYSFTLKQRETLWKLFSRSRPTMRTQIFAAAALLASSAAATNTWTRIDTSPADSFRFLRARQGGESFKPDQTNGSGETCEDAFGAGYIQCGTTGKVCFNPNIGQSCCDGYSCPSGSGCLTNGYCCPDDLGPKACLEKLGMSNLPPFLPSATAMPSASTPANTPSETPSEPPADKTPSEYPTSPSATPSAAPTAATITPIYPTASPSRSVCTAANTASNNKIYPTGTLPSQPPSASPPVYGNGAISAEVATAAVAVLGLLSFIQNLL
ncbi:conserved hypothetical protein [Histoplasma capsulatum H143]|uniref:Prp 4 CRoW domain-containing protein n=1 Tax=Ajellomyces capsulatus (strain H143) TaxID=544712 RepID=C6HHR9_AJECH|nr:conserved hypothetical protein [Histoplasma capsulatum H143]